MSEGVERQGTLKLQGKGGLFAKSPLYFTQSVWCKPRLSNPLPQGLSGAMDRLGPYRGPRWPIAPPR